jgi:hypothetical protein
MTTRTLVGGKTELIRQQFMRFLGAVHLRQNASAAGGAALDERLREAYMEGVETGIWWAMYHTKELAVERKKAESPPDTYELRGAKP